MSHHSSDSLNIMRLTGSNLWVLPFASLVVGRSRRWTTALITSSKCDRQVPWQSRLMDTCSAPACSGPTIATIVSERRHHLDFGRCTLYLVFVDDQHYSCLFLTALEDPRPLSSRDLEAVRFLFVRNLCRSDSSHFNRDFEDSAQIVLLRGNYISDDRMHSERHLVLRAHIRTHERDVVHHSSIRFVLICNWRRR